MIINIIGLTGMILILFAFLMNQLHKWRDTFFIYDITNAIGSILLIIYSFLINSWPFIILNGVWFIISMRDIFLDIGTKERYRTNIGYKKKRNGR